MYNRTMKRWIVLLICLILLYSLLVKIQGAWFYPALGMATWYEPHYTASGETYQEGQFTCAMRKRGFGKNYLVCNLENNKCVEVRHTDFGPTLYHYVRGKIIDLSRNAFAEIADLDKGVIRVRIGEIYPAQVD